MFDVLLEPNPSSKFQQYSNPSLLRLPTPPMTDVPDFLLMKQSAQASFLGYHHAALPQQTRSSAYFSSRARITVPQLYHKLFGAGLILFGDHFSRHLAWPPRWLTGLAERIRVAQILWKAYVDSWSWDRGVAFTLRGALTYSRFRLYCSCYSTRLFDPPQMRACASVLHWRQDNRSHLHRISTTASVHIQKLLVLSLQSIKPQSRSISV